MTATLVRPTRADIIARAKHMRGEIDQIFNDAAHWNSANACQAPIDPDPDGKLRRLAEGIDRFLAAEEARGKQD